MKKRQFQKLQTSKEKEPKRKFITFSRARDNPTWKYTHVYIFMGLGVFSNIILFFCLSVMAASPPASSRAADAAGTYSIAFQTLHWKPNITNEIMGARFSVHTLHWKTRTDTTTGALTHVNTYVKERLFIRLDRLFIIYFLYLCTRYGTLTVICKDNGLTGMADFKTRCQGTW